MTHLRLLVRGNAMEAMHDARIHGVDATVHGVRGDGNLVLHANLSQYPAVLKWWQQGGRLVKTLGPDEPSGGRK